jgi:hypothetical protein
MTHTNESPVFPGRFNRNNDKVCVPLHPAYVARFMFYAWLAQLNLQDLNRIAKLQPVRVLY